MDEISGQIAAGGTLLPVCRRSARQLGSPVNRQTRWARSGREWQGAQPRQSAAEPVLPGPALGKMQGEAACLAGDACSDGEKAPPQGLGGHHRFAQTNAGRTAGQIVCQHLQREPALGKRPV